MSIKNQILNAELLAKLAVQRTIGAWASQYFVMTRLLTTWSKSETVIKWKFR